MRHFRSILKSNSAKIFLAAILILLGSYGLTLAGSLTPSSLPGPTGYTLNDIYNKIQTFSFSPGSHTLSTTTSPAPSFHSLTDIYNLLSGQTDLTSGNIKTGATIFGVAGSYTASSSGNATVPNDAPIQPVQAFVDNILALTKLTHPSGNGNAALLDLSNKGITYFDGSLLFQDGPPDQTGVLHWLAWAQRAGYYPLTADLSGNALSQASVDDILSKAVAAIPSGLSAVLDLSGGTNAAPTNHHQDAIIRLDFNGINFASDPPLEGNFGQTDQNGDGPTLLRLDDGGTLSNSSFTPDVTGGNLLLDIGTGDEPTNAQVIAKLVSIGGGKIVDNGDGTVNVTMISDSVFPYDLTDEGSGVGGTVVQAGSASYPDKSTLQLNGWTVLTN